jgi:predicted amidohydrolase
MKIALPVIRLGNTPEENLVKVIHAIDSSSDRDFVFFAETAITGLIPNDNVPEMLALGQEVPGEITRRLAEACRRNGTWVSVGLLERDEGRLYDAAVVLNSFGDIVMKYRRTSPGWHWPGSDPEVFCQGTDVLSVETPFGRMATLICGDFFDHRGQFEKLTRLKPDFLHLLLMRSRGENIHYSEEDWRKTDLPEYSSRVKSLGIPVFMVNYIDEYSYGGAAVVKKDGSIACSLPVWREGILNTDFP